MEFLNISNFDEARQRSTCPFHNENTPSFIFNPKQNNMHCFGCGINIDIVDAYMKGKNKTFIEAVQKLFELTGITYSFGEHKVKTKRQYRYPKPVECTSKTQIYDYLSKRKISQETADYLDLREDEQGNIVFNYYDLNDTLTMVKYRPGRKVKKGENKNWCQPGADTAPILFNINRINPTQPLVICSGELDCAALIESGIQNSVSIPLGDSNLQWIEECWDFLEQFKEIIIVPDNDESGKKYCKEVIPRLGSWRCKVARCPEVCELSEGKTVSIKDVNETLVRLGKEEVINVIANAKDSPIPSVVDFSDVEEKDLSNIDGITTGIGCIDKELMRIFYGSFNILSGTPGSGKTSFLYQLVCQALDQGAGSWVFSRELPPYMTKNWVNYLLSGPRNLNQYISGSGSIYYKVKPLARQMIDDHYRGQLFLYRDDYGNDVESIQSSMVDSARKYGSRLFILDNLMTIDLGANDNNKWEKQTEFVNWLIQFSMKYNVCTMLVCHPRKLQFGQSDVGMYDVAGSSNLVNLAHRGIGLRRVSKAEREGKRNKKGDGWEAPPCPYNVIVNIIKDRFRGRSGSEFGLYYDEASRRFFTTPEEYGWQYKWDGTAYTDELSYPIDDLEDEILGQISGG